MTREEAINMLKSKMDGHTDTSYEWTETVRMAIKALEQEPKIGHWESFDPTDDGDIYKCSICKCTANVPTVLGIPMFKYCPNCGAKMVEPQESEG